AQKHADAVVKVVRCYQVELAVAIEVCHRHGHHGIVQGGGIILTGGKDAVAVTQRYAGAAGTVGRGEIEFAVAVQVRHGQTAVRAVGHEAAGSDPQPHADGISEPRQVGFAVAVEISRGDGIDEVAAEVVAAGGGESRVPLSQQHSELAGGRSGGVVLG